MDFGFFFKSNLDWNLHTITRLPFLQVQITWSILQFWSVRKTIAHCSLSLLSHGTHGGGYLVHLALRYLNQHSKCTHICWPISFDFYWIAAMDSKCSKVSWNTHTVPTQLTLYHSIFMFEFCVTFCELTVDMLSMTCPWSGLKHVGGSFGNFSFESWQLDKKKEKETSWPSSWCNVKVIQLLHLQTYLAEVHNPAFWQSVGTI
jgi:hypothetical protein